MASHAALHLFADDGPLGRRGAPRQRVLLGARLVTIVDEHEVRIRDLSTTGARVEGDVPAAGTDVMVQRGTHELFGRIVWSDGRRGGIEFEEPLSPGDLFTAICPVPPAPRPTVVHRRPGFRPATLTAQEQARAAAWFRPTGRPSLGD